MRREIRKIVPYFGVNRKTGVGGLRNEERVLRKTFPYFVLVRNETPKYGESIRKEEAHYEIRRPFI